MISGKLKVDSDYGHYPLFFFGDEFVLVIQALACR